MKRIPYLIFVFLIFFASCKPENGSIAISTKDLPVKTPSSTVIQPNPSQTPAGKLRPQPTTHSQLDFQLEELSDLQLSFWHPWTGKMAEQIDIIVQEFNQTNVWGIEVITTSLGGYAALSLSVNENLEAGTLPHILVAPSEQLLLWQEQNAIFMDLSTYINEPQWGLTDQERSSIPISFWEQDKIDTYQIGFPALRDMQVLFYNQTWARELGFFTPPQSFEVFAEQACAAAEKRKNIDETGGWIIDIDPLTVLSWILTNAPEGIYDPESDEYRFNTPDVLQVFNQMRQLFDKGCAWNSRLPDSSEYFADRQALMITGSLKEVLNQEVWMQKKGNTDEWIILPFPVKNGKPVIITSGISYAVQQTTPQEQFSSWLFIHWLMIPRNQAQQTEISGLLPASVSTVELSKNFINTYPKWQSALTWVPLISSVPHTGSWTVVQNMLEDTAWQIFQPNMNTENLGNILQELDLMIPEVLNMINQN